jgi:hypothetical protein
MQTLGLLAWSPSHIQKSEQGLAENALRFLIVFAKGFPLVHAAPGCADCNLQGAKRRESILIGIDLRKGNATIGENQG